VTLSVSSTCAATQSLCCYPPKQSGNNVRSTPLSLTWKPNPATKHAPQIPVTPSRQPLIAAIRNTQSKPTLQTRTPTQLKWCRFTAPAPEQHKELDGSPVKALDLTAQQPLGTLSMPPAIQEVPSLLHSSHRSKARDESSSSRIRHRCEHIIHHTHSSNTPRQHRCCSSRPSTA